MAGRVPLPLYKLGGAALGELQEPRELELVHLHTPPLLDPWERYLVTAGLRETSSCPFPEA